MADDDKYLSDITPDALEISQAVWDLLYPTINPSRRARLLKIYGGGVMKYVIDKVTMTDTLRIMFQSHKDNLGADATESYIINEIYPDNGKLASSVGQHHVIYCVLDPNNHNANISNTVTSTHYSNFDGDVLDTGNIVILGVTDDSSFYSNFIDYNFLYTSIIHPLNWSKITCGVSELNPPTINSTLDIIAGDNINITFDDVAKTMRFDVQGDIGASIQHHDLLGLGDNDHPQYLLRDGTNTMNGNFLPLNNTINVGSGGTTFGTGYFQQLISTFAPTLPTHVVNKEYLEAFVNGLDWQESVLSFYDPTGGLPGSPSTGDRYISEATANGWIINRIYEWTSSSWDDTEPNKGFSCFVEDENTVYIYNGTGWTKAYVPADHGSLTGLADDDHLQYFKVVGRTAEDLTVNGNIIVTGLVDGVDVAEVGADSLKLLHGFNPDQLDNFVLSGNKTTRQIILTHVSDYEIYINSVKKVITETKQLGTPFSNTEGFHWIYYQVAGDNLYSSTSQVLITDRTKVLVAIIYWSTVDNDFVYIGYECHTAAISPEVRYSIRYTIVDKYGYGLEVTDATAGQVAVSNGVIFDEEIAINIINGSGGGLFEQVLNPIAYLPIFYRHANGWRLMSATNKPFYDNSGVDEVHYNKNVVGSWSTEATSSPNNYVAYFICGWNEISNPVMVIMGQDSGQTTLRLARENNRPTEIDFGNIPTNEFPVLYRILVRNNLIEEITDYRTGEGLYSIDELEEMVEHNTIVTDALVEKTFRDRYSITAITNQTNPQVTLVCDCGDGYNLFKLDKDIYSIDDDTLTLVGGTLTSPTTNWITVSQIDGVPQFNVVQAQPDYDTDIVGIARILVGGVANNWKFYTLEDKTSYGCELEKRLYRRAITRGGIWIDGFALTIDGSNYFQITSGEANCAITVLEGGGRDTSGTDLVYYYDSTPLVQSYDNVNDIVDYGGGETIGNAKYFNVIVFYILSSNNQTIGQIWSAVQDKPSTEYNSLASAMDDGENKIVYAVDNSISHNSVHIARLIIQKGVGVNTVIRNIDLRGQIIGAGGGGATPSDHGNLTGLSDDDHSTIYYNKTTIDGFTVKLSGNQTVNGIKTFGSFPITPSSAPTANYQVANKKYVDDSVSAGGDNLGNHTATQDLGLVGFSLIGTGFNLSNSNLNLLDDYCGAGVSAIEFGHISTVSSNVQTQLNGKTGIADAEVITGTWNFNTDSGTHPFYISRLGGTVQALKIYMDDNNLYFDLDQDEAGTHNVIWNSINTNPDYWDYQWKIGGDIHFKIDHDLITIYKNADFSNGIDVTGNITVTGTVDGVDVATLKTDVDGFPDALKSVTASAAEINKLDGLLTTKTELGYVNGVSSAIQTQINGKLSLSGGTMAGTLAMNNNAITGIGSATIADNGVNEGYMGVSNAWGFHHPETAQGGYDAVEIKCDDPFQVRQGTTLVFEAAVNGVVTIPHGDLTWGLSTAITLALGTDGTKAGAIRLYGDTIGGGGLIQSTTNNLHIDTIGGNIYLGHYDNCIIYFNGSTYKIDSSGNAYFKDIHIPAGDKLYLGTTAYFIRGGSNEIQVLNSVYFEVKPTGDSYGFIIRDSGSTSYGNLKNVNGITYLGDQTDTNSAMIAIDGTAVTFPGTIGCPSGTTINEFSTDGTLVGDSDNAIPTEKAVKKYVDDNAGGTDYDPDLMIGSSNSAWVVAILLGDGLTTDSWSKLSMGRGSGTMTVQNVDATNLHIFYICNLPTNRGGKKLYIDAFRIGLHNASASGYITTAYLLGQTYNTQTNLITNGTNKTTVGLHTYAFTAVDISSYEQAGLKFTCLNSTAGALSVMTAAFRCYYN